MIEGYNEVVSMVIFGHPPRKSNARILTTNTGSPRIIKSRKALAYVDDFIVQAKSFYTGYPLGSLEQSLRADFVIYYPSRRSDLSVELILDCLEKAEVIKNDRYIQEMRLWGFIDKKDPRTHIKIYTIQGDRTPPF